jgi:hypothetical protein
MEQEKQTKEKPAARKKAGSAASGAQKKARAPAAKKSGDASQGSAKKKIGRPSIYTPELAAKVCEYIADGKSMRTIASIDGMPSTFTLLSWLDGSKPEFSIQYAHARELQADKLAEEILDISDNGQSDKYIDEDGREKVDNEVVQRSKLRVDARKWLASKMAPKKYGEKIAIGGADGLGPVQSVVREASAAEMTDDQLAAIIARHANAD